MSLTAPTLTPGKAIAGLAIVLSLLIGISVALGTDPTKSPEQPIAVGQGFAASPVPLSTGTPPMQLPTPTLEPAPSPPGTLPPVVRDLTQYENGGTMTLGIDVSGENREQVLEHLRSFVLRKWNARQLGRLSFVSFSPRNQALTRSFFVERGVGGVWQVALEMPDTEPKIYRFVQEIGVAADGHPILEPNRPGSPPAVTRALHLKQQAGIKTGLIF